MLRSRSDPDQTLAHLAQSEWRIREGAARLARLRTLVAGLERDGHPTHRGRSLIRQFEVALAAEVQGRDRLQKAAQAAD